MVEDNDRNFMGLATAGMWLLALAYLSPFGITFNMAQAIGAILTMMASKFFFSRRTEA